MPQSKSTVVSYIAPDTLRRLEAQGVHIECRGDSLCRCRRCKPALGFPHRETETTRLVEYVLIAALVIVGAVLSVAAYHG